MLVQFTPKSKNLLKNYNLHYQYNGHSVKTKADFSLYTAVVIETLQITFRKLEICWYLIKRTHFRHSGQIVLKKTEQ